MMIVDFNNLRLQIAYSLDNVIKTLNDGKLPEDEHVLLDNDKWKSGNILVDYDILENNIKELRQMVHCLICCYEKGNEEYIDLSDKLEQNGGISHF